MADTMASNTMIYLEDESIPRPLYDALVESNKDYGVEVKEFLRDKYKYQHISSVTSLNTPTQKAELIKRHGNDIYIDPLKDCWHSMMGNVVHWVLEKHASNNPAYMSERRMGCEIVVDGVTCYLHGKFDLYEIGPEKLQDWKLTSASNMMYPKTSYELQLNVLRYIMMKNGYKVSILENVYLFPHLDKTKMKMEGYPQRNELTVRVKIMPIGEVEQYIKERLRAQLTEKNKRDAELTPCTDEERWVRNSFWGIYTRKKQGPKDAEGKRDFSSRLAFRANSKSELITWRKANGHLKGDVKYREFKGEPKACGFCPAKVACRQYQREKIELQNQQQEQ